MGVQEIIKRVCAVEYLMLLPHAGHHRAIHELINID